MIVVDRARESSPEAVAQLQQWLREEHGARIADGVVFDASRADGRGAYIQAEQYAPGEPLIELPLGACIYEQTVLADEQLGEVMGALLERSGSGAEVVTVVAFLLRERGRGRASKWWPYIESLPWAHVGSEQVSPLWWSELELQRLQGSRARTEAVELRRQLKQITDILFPIFRSKRIPIVASARGQPNTFIKLAEVPAAWFSTGQPPREFCDAVREAFALVLSRRVSIPGLSSTVLAPLIDRLGYAPSSAPSAYVDFRRPEGYCQPGRERGGGEAAGGDGVRLGSGADEGYIICYRELDYFETGLDEWVFEEGDEELLERARDTASRIAGGADTGGMSDAVLGPDGAVVPGLSEEDAVALASVGAFDDDPPDAEPEGVDAVADAVARADAAADVLAAAGFIELAHCYNGCASNADLLVTYGLVPQSLTAETCRATVTIALRGPDGGGRLAAAAAQVSAVAAANAGLAPWPRAGGGSAADADLLAWKEQLLRVHGLSPTAQAFEIGLPGEPFHVPPDLLGYLRLAAIDDEVERKVVESSDAPWQLLCGELCIFDSVPVSESVDRQAVRLLLSACREALALYQHPRDDAPQPDALSAEFAPIEERSERTQRSIERAVDAARLVQSEQLVLRATIEMLETFGFRWLSRCSMTQ